MNIKESYYDILGIQKNTSDEEVKRAYHALAKKFHPDRNPKNRRLAELRFRLINEAYGELSTREKRARYNRTCRLQAQNDNKILYKQPGDLLAQIGAIFWPKNKEFKN